MILYRIGSSGQTLILADRVLNHFLRYRQRRGHQREAGGQLFARFNGTQIFVEEVTGPRRSDWRTRISYVPDRAMEQAEIYAQYERGLHYIGDWHTHPQKIPIPSSIDVRSICDCVRQSQHTLNAFVLIIIGVADPPEGLHVSIHDDVQTLVLQPTPHVIGKNLGEDFGQR